MSDQHRVAVGGHHLFIAVEAGPTANGVDWDAIRQLAIEKGFYVSLAVVKGAKSDWIVRPVPTVEQIPALVSTSGAGAASSGIAAAVIDQLMEAQALVPAIRTTEVRLYGGALVESELHEALQAEKSVWLLVFEKGRFRKARSTYKTPASSAHATAGVRTGTASLRQTTQPTRPTQLMKPSSQSAGGAVGTPNQKAIHTHANSIAGRKAAAARAGTRGQPQTSQSTRGTTGTPVVAPSKPNQRVAGDSFTKRFQPARRIFAGLLAAATVGIGVFPGFVVANIWGYSYPRDATLIAEDISSAQSRAFMVSALFGLFIAVVGTRARWLTLLGLGYGVLVGVLPAAIPDFLASRAPQPIGAILWNTAGFWGPMTAFAPLIYVGLGIALCSAVAGVLPDTPNSVILARQRNRTLAKDWFGRRSPVDHRAISLMLWLSLTAVVPWLLGRFVLQDNILFKSGAGVFDKGGREFWPYVPPLYVGGVTILFLAAGLAMVFQPWQGRKGLGLTGFALLGIGLAACSLGTNLWSAAEQGTADRLMSSEFPFGDQYDTCGHASATLTDADGEAWLYQVWTARAKNSEIGYANCNLIQVYKGWEWVESHKLPDGQIIAEGPEFVSGTTSVDVVFQYVQTDLQSNEQSDEQTIELTLEEE